MSNELHSPKQIIQVDASPLETHFSSFSTSIFFRAEPKAMCATLAPLTTTAPWRTTLAQRQNRWSTRCQSAGKMQAKHIKRAYKAKKSKHSWFRTHHIRFIDQKSTNSTTTNSPRSDPDETPNTPSPKMAMGPVQVGKS